MIELIHRYRKTLGGFIILFLLTLAMSGFGIHASQYAGNQGSSAITVDDRSYSFDDLARERRDTRLSGQQLADRIIATDLIEHTAKTINLSAGESAVRELLVQDLFRGSFDPTAYTMFLQQSGMSAAQFEAQLKRDAVKRQLMQLLGDSSEASQAEAKALLIREETAIDAQYLEIDPAAYLSKVPAPSAEEMQKYYEENSSAFETPPTAAYDYVLLTPEQFERSVEVSDDEVELYLVDHEAEFSIPEAIRARHIKIALAKDPTEEQRMLATEKANQALSRAKAGESFDSLVAEFSDDMATKFIGGDLGWLTRGKLDPAIDAAAFSLKGPGLTEVVSTDIGLEIVKVDQYKPSALKPVSEVRNQIVAIIQKREAPAYAANRAAELLEEWTKTNKPLAEFAKEQKLTAVSTKGLFAAGTDPEDRAKGLTAQVLNRVGEQRFVTDVGEFSALVEVRESKEADIAPFESVKKQIEATLRQSSAVTLAKQNAERILEATKADATLSSIAKSEKLTLRESNGMKRSGSLSGIFQNPQVAEAVFSGATANAKPEKVLSLDGKFYLVQVTGSTPPDLSKLTDKVMQYQRMQSAKNTESLVESLINQMKKQSEITISPAVLAEG